MHFVPRISRRAGAGVLIASLTAGVAGAATLHRFNVTQSAGSGGATAFVQSSASGGALQGEVATAANTHIATPFGVLGEYDTAGTFGSGVIGVSTTGYGVAGETLSANPSVLAYPGGTGPGVLALTAKNSSIHAAVGAVSYSDSDGIDAYSGQNSTGNGTGVYAEAVNPSGAGDGIAGVADGSGDGVGGFAESGRAGYFQSNATNGGSAELGGPNGYGLWAIGAATNESVAAIVAEAKDSGADLVQTYTARTPTSPRETFVIQGFAEQRSGSSYVTRTDYSDVQVSGDLYVAGKVYSECATFPIVSYEGSGNTPCLDVQTGNVVTDATARTAGSDVQMYHADQSLPTVEDFGQAQLVDGHAFVRLDPAFARTMSAGSPYMVFVTPEGQSHGVFTTAHSAGGFEVVENDNGRSTTTFDYRIVGRPFGDKAQRFAPPVRAGRTGSTPANAIAAAVTLREAADRAAHRNGMLHARPDYTHVVAPFAAAK